jgi:hypothetical protein
MHISVLIFIELIFILLLGIIVFVSKKQRNFFLSYNLNLVILIIAVLKLFWFLWAYQNNMNTMCEFSNHLYC